MYYEEVRDPKLRDLFREAEEKGFSTCREFRRAFEALREATWEEAVEHPRSPYWAYLFSLHVRMSVSPDLELLIMRDAHCACMYACFVLMRRWREAEPIIARDPVAAVVYAEKVICGRWPDAEVAILAHPGSMIRYAERVIRGRWTKAERAILEVYRDPSVAYGYAIKVVRGPWPEGEPLIRQDVMMWHWYTQTFHIQNGGKA